MPSRENLEVSLLWESYWWWSMNYRTFFAEIIFGIIWIFSKPSWHNKKFVVDVVAVVVAVVVVVVVVVVAAAEKKVFNALHFYFALFGYSNLWLICIKKPPHLILLQANCFQQVWAHLIFCLNFFEKAWMLCVGKTILRLQIR